MSTRGTRQSSSRRNDKILVLYQQDQQTTSFPASLCSNWQIRKQHESIPFGPLRKPGTWRCIHRRFFKSRKFSINRSLVTKILRNKFIASLLQRCQISLAKQLLEKYFDIQQKRPKFPKEISSICCQLIVNRTSLSFKSFSQLFACTA